MARYAASQNNRFGSLIQNRRFKRGLVWGVMIVGALLAFELFNFSTTDFALSDLLGDLSFFGMSWATILAIAFCGIDFAGIARLFTPEEGADEPAEVWYLFGAWLLAATMNAMLTWWGVSIAILQHQTLGNAVVSREVLLNVVPVFVAVMVWLSRVLIIGTFSVAGERLFSQPEQRASQPVRPPRARAKRKPEPTYARSSGRRSGYTQPAFKRSQKPVNRPNSIYASSDEAAYPPRPEPTYHPVSAAPRGGRQNSPGTAQKAGRSGNQGYR